LSNLSLSLYFSEVQWNYPDPNIPAADSTKQSVEFRRFFGSGWIDGLAPRFFLRFAQENGAVFELTAADQLYASHKLPDIFRGHIVFFGQVILHVAHSLNGLLC
jgi:hypothetical protein